MLLELGRASPWTKAKACCLYEDEVPSALSGGSALYPRKCAALEAVPVGTSLKRRSMPWLVTQN